MDIIKCTLQAGGIGIWKCWFLWREENWTTWRKTLEAMTRTNVTNSTHI